jgi:catechol 2,3-dioxygenase-like lactoylglutathione lyase family enzyme
MTQGNVSPIQTAPNPIDPGVRIGHVHLRTADIDRVRDFYVGVLGFDVVAEARDVPLRARTRAGRVEPGPPSSLNDFMKSLLQQATGGGAAERLLDGAATVSSAVAAGHHVGPNSPG